jgi:dipeptidyl-peptidase 4
MVKKQMYILVALVFALTCILGTSLAQDRLPSMPGYEQYQKMSPQLRGAVKQGSVNVTWAEDGKSFEYSFDGKKYQYDLKKKKSTVIGEAEQQAGGRFGRFAGRGGRGNRPQRGRQYTFALSPDEKIKAFYKDNNLWLSDPEGNNVKAITTEGNSKDRVKYGSASWTYGEELRQTTAMWWSPNSDKIAYYRFDESMTKDFYVLHKQIELQDSVEIEPYIKVGADNPIVDLYIYDINKKNIVKVDVRDGKPFTRTSMGNYIYGISWSSDGKELLFHRTNRKQDIMEWAAADPNTGKCRVIVREEWLPSFTMNTPPMRYLEDNYRFIWTSERNGFRNFYLYDLSGKLLKTLTNHQFEVSNIVKVDEKAKQLYYMARDGENHMMMQLHRVGLNGKGDVRLTDPAYNHRVTISPDGKYFIDIIQTHNKPPETRLLDKKGKVIDVLAKSDMSKFDELGLKKVEMFTFKAADGVTELHGMLHFPSNFDPNKKYPLLAGVYAGPGSNGARETFMTPNALTEYGFLSASFDTRSSSGKGKKSMDASYGKLGIVEMDDLAEGVKSLYSRSYFDKNKVGIYGTSYGGYASAMCILRFPDVFQAAVANSAVTDFRLYDDIYTERYNGLLWDNEKGYEDGSAMKYAENLKGDLMIYYGTSDNNVHPSNAMQLITALQKAKKHFEVQVGPDRGHTGVNRDRMMEFFIENLVIKK